MQYILQLILVCLIIFLYCLFVLTKDDFILLRKNVTLDYLFNTTFIGLIISLLSARVVYVFEHLNPKYLNPLILFIFPYFPGLSLTGGLIGGAGFIFYITKKKKLPVGRIFDALSLAFFLAWSSGLIIYFFITLLFLKKSLLPFLAGGFLGILVFSVFVKIFTRNKLKDGEISTIGFSFFIFLQLFINSLLRGKMHFFSFLPEDFLLCAAILACLICFILQQKTQLRNKIIRKKP